MSSSDAFGILRKLSTALHFRFIEDHSDITYD